MQRFILQQNLARFRTLLAGETDPSEQRILLQLVHATQRQLAAFNAASLGAQHNAAVASPGGGGANFGQFRDQFEMSAQLYLLLDPRPGLHIVDATEAYAAATLITRGSASGERMFDVFPDNPDDPLADGVSNLFNSLQLAAETGRPHVMAIQRYDVRGPDGKFITRYWRPANIPLYDSDGRLVYLLHQAEDVTEQMSHPESRPRQDQDAGEIDSMIAAALDRAWSRVESHPAFRRTTPSRLRARLMAHLETLARQGERDTTMLADYAIHQLYQELGR